MYVYVQSHMTSKNLEKQHEERVWEYEERGEVEQDAEQNFLATL